MALFNQSVKTWAAVVQEIADSAGASGDSDMQGRAHRSLQASLEYLNAKANWDFLFTEADPIAIVPPFTIAVTASAGQTSATCSADPGVVVDDLLTGGPFGLGTRVTATASATAAGPVNVTALGLNRTTLLGIANGGYDSNVVRDMYPLPSAFKQMYSARLLSTMSTLRMLRRRFYDRSTSDEFGTSTPVGYDISLIPLKGKVRMLKPPSAVDVLQIRYYRRFTIATASANTDALDIPQDYEPYVIAWAKWHFLTDKGENERAQTWLAFAEEGVRTMLGDQNRLPDEDLRFTPGHFTYDPGWGPNSTRHINWDW